MNHTLRNLRIDQYPLTHVDCVEKAICLMLSEYEESSASVYLMYLNLFRCCEREKNSFFGTQMEVLEHLCRQNILPLEFHTRYVSEHVSDVVTELLEQGKTCLVPGNLYELFYSKHYHDSHWPHLFFINGCNKKEQLFHIMDSVQKCENEHIFSKFVMECATLSKIYQSYCSVYPDNMMYHKNNVIYYLEKDKSEKPECISITDHIYRIIKRLMVVWDGATEYEMLNSVQKLYSQNGNSDNHYRTDVEELLGNVRIKFGRLIKRKEVLFSEIVANMQDYTDESAKSGLDRDLKLLINHWNSFFRLMIANCMRKNTEGLKEKLGYVIAEEKQYVNQLYRCMEHIMEMDMQMSDDRIWKYENDAGEISFDHGDFLLKINRECNAWIEDNALKIMRKESLEDKKMWKLTIHMRIGGAYLENNFHAGILFRTKQGKLYFWGCYNEECIRLSDIGIKLELLDVPFDERIIDVCLGIAADESGVSLYCKTKCGEDNYIPIQIAKEEISEIGFGCKTWESEFSNELTVKYDHISCVLEG